MPVQVNIYVGGEKYGKSPIGALAGISSGLVAKGDVKTQTKEKEKIMHPHMPPYHAFAHSYASTKRDRHSYKKTQGKIFNVFFVCLFV